MVVRYGCALHSRGTGGTGATSHRGATFMGPQPSPGRSKPGAEPSLHWRRGGIRNPRIDRRSRTEPSRDGLRSRARRGHPTVRRGKGKWREALQPAFVQ
ncbi:hypothetical protein NDU88_003338 [Pleurodeles waltl]|uniref:Uncharacterized protein n=1 Tax=Pleurodeles waltl TaxID=8319 RepID=A0AAV7TN80_PLEWA|nr:hypothetical protein NDU88_003338 [Pleurodeles waltl]